jgi:hypothetical protein
MTDTPNLTPTAIKDAWFFVAVFGRGQTSRIVHGWDALCDAVVYAAFGEKPNPASRAGALKELTDWSDWVFDFGGLPFNKIMRGDGGGIEVFRIIETKGLSNGTENKG